MEHTPTYWKLVGTFKSCSPDSGFVVQMENHLAVDLVFPPACKDATNRASLIVTAVNEHEALLAVAEAAANLVASVNPEIFRSAKAVSDALAALDRIRSVKL